MTELPAGLLAALDLEATGTGSFRAPSFGEAEGQLIFGGQLLAQTLLAASRVESSKAVKSIQLIFVRSGSVAQGVEIDVEALHSGRTFSSAAVTIRQGDRACTSALVLLAAPEDDLIRHSTTMPSVTGPDQTLPNNSASPWWEVRVVGGVNVADPNAVGPAVLDIWTRFPGAPAEPPTNQALLAYASDGFLIGTAMRPHHGVGQSLAHSSIATTVITHTIAFHEPIDASEWMLLSHESPYSGRGGSYGRANVFTQDGRLVASFVQENMIRAMAQPKKE
ncbi:MAG: hypothetical protein QOC92_2465 [Acidimicrobiaceae bacterium]